MSAIPLLQFEVNTDLIDEGFTQSELQCWDDCPEKWYLGYNLLLQKKGKFSWALVYGTWMHQALEEFYASKGKRFHVDPVLKDRRFLNQQTLADFEYWSRLAEIQMQMYASFYKNDFKAMFDIEHTETTADVEFEGVRLKGKLDIFAWSKLHKGFYVVDHKTTSRLDKQTAMGWDFRLQFMIYCWFAWKLWPKTPVHGYFVNAIKKPQLKRGEKETVDAFLQRVQIDMQERPETYFYRERLRLKKPDLKHFENTILRPKIERIKLLLSPKVKDEVKIAILRNKNTDTCIKYGQPCEFLPVCKNGWEIEHRAYHRRDVKHQELVEE